MTCLFAMRVFPGGFARRVLGTLIAKESPRLLFMTRKLAFWAAITVAALGTLAVACDDDDAKTTPAATDSGADSGPTSEAGPGSDAGSDSATTTDGGNDPATTTDSSTEDAAADAGSDAPADAATD